jgi:NADH-quinone oxidoreductase subunit F
MKLVFGEGSCGIAAGARKVRAAVEKLNAEGAVEIGITGCIGMCYLEPIVDVYDGGTLVKRFVKVDESAAPALYEAAKTGDLAPLAKYEISADDKEFLEKQTRIALRHCGLIDPEDIEEYIARDGYFALADCLLNRSPKAVIDEIKKSGLRGRGGGGFPTGLKWEIASKNKNKEKYVVCNADEGDPGAFMDRSIMEGDPNSIVEAMAICGYATGASNGLVYIRAEYPLAVERL